VPSSTKAERAMRKHGVRDFAICYLRIQPLRDAYDLRGRPQRKTYASQRWDAVTANSASQ